MKRISSFTVCALYTLVPWILVLWYRTTLWFTYDRTQRIHPVSSPSLIRNLLSQGGYEADPAGGSWDIMRHPTQVQSRALDEVGVGDCEDHAIYWATVLLVSDLADRAWIGIFSTNGHSRRIGHAVCVFEKEGVLSWVDYRLPKVITKKWDWAEDSTTQIEPGSIPTCAALIEVSVNEDLNPSLKIEVAHHRW